MAVKKKTKVQEIPIETLAAIPSSIVSLQKNNKNIIIFLSLGFILLVTIFFLKRDWIITASVNGTYISNFDSNFISK